MGWTKPTAEIIGAFDAALSEHPVAQRKMMFGSPAAFINGNMFAVVHQQNVVLRLPEAQRTEFLKLDGAGPFEPMPGRPMREYVVVPPSMAGRPSELSRWLSTALEYAASLAPRAKKSRTPKASPRRAS